MPEYFDKSWVLGELKDGRLIAKGRNALIVGSGDVSLTVRVPDLRAIEHVIEVETYTDPRTYHQSYYKWISGNTVGLTIYQVNAGTTLTVDVVAIGTP